MTPVELPFGPAAPDFSDPLGLLAACHARMRGYCALLERLLARLPAHAADLEIRQGAGQLIRYFTTAAPHHHADEEQDLFPLLDGDPALGPRIAQLRREHAHLDALWAGLAPHLEQLGSGRVTAQLGSAAEAFIGALACHIEMEDAHILPAARELLDRTQIRALGLAMARRRGVT